MLKTIQRLREKHWGKSQEEVSKTWLRNYSAKK